MKVEIGYANFIIKLLLVLLCRNIHFSAIANALKAYRLIRQILGLCEVVIELLQKQFACSQNNITSAKGKGAFK